MTAQDSVAYASLTAGIVCFVMYVALTAIAAIASLRQPKVSAKTAHIVAKSFVSAGVSVSDATDLLKSVAQLSDSLSKAAPSLVALIGAILFFLIASIASGALHGAPPAPAPKAAPAAGAPPAVEPKA
jgi:hypothetical protein